MSAFATHRTARQRFFAEESAPSGAWGHHSGIVQHRQGGGCQAPHEAKVTVFLFGRKLTQRPGSNREWFQIRTRRISRKVSLPFQGNFRFRSNRRCGSLLLWIARPRIRIEQLSCSKPKVFHSYSYFYFIHQSDKIRVALNPNHSRSPFMYVYLKQNDW